MSKRVKVVVINLKESHERRKRVLESLKPILTDYVVEVFPAVDSSNIKVDNIDPVTGVLTVPEYGKFLLDYTRKIDRDRIPTIPKGMIGCCLSHLVLYERLCNDPDYDHYVILEDDARLMIDEHAFTDYITHLPEDYDLIYVNSESKYLPVERDLYGWRDVRFSKIIKRFFNCSVSYIISKQGARKLLINSRSTVSKPSDDFLSNAFVDGTIDVLMTNQWMFTNDYSLESDIINKSTPEEKAFLLSITDNNDTERVNQMNKLSLTEPTNETPPPEPQPEPPTNETPPPEPQPEPQPEPPTNETPPPEPQPNPPQPSSGDMIPLFKVAMNPNVDLNPTLLSGFITQGKKVEEFEKKLRVFFNHPWVVTVNSATSGLIIASRMMDLPRGSEVLCTPMTCFATTTAIRELGLEPRWVDVNPKTFNISVESVCERMTPRTKALAFVHWGGTPVPTRDLDHILKYAKDTYGTNLQIIQDCAHAFGARDEDGVLLGAREGVGTSVYSFQAIKHLTTGDGGVILCKSEEDYERARLLRWYGISRERRTKGRDVRMEPDIPETGYKFHMNDIAADLGIQNFDLAVQNSKLHTQNARDLIERITRELGPHSGVKFQVEPSGTTSSYWILSFLTSQKERLTRELKRHGIACSQVHRRNDTHSCVARFYSPRDVPMVDKMERELLCIPCGWWLTSDDKDKIVQAFKDIIKPVQLQIRRAEPGDEVFANLSREIIDSQVDFYDEIFVATLRNGPDEGKVVGSVRMITNKRYNGSLLTRMEEVFTHVDYRRRGVANNLLQVVMYRYQYLGGPRKIVLCTEIPTLYEPLGFVKVGDEMVYRM